MRTSDEIAKAFHAALVGGDWPAMHQLFQDDAT